MVRQFFWELIPQGKALVGSATERGDDRDRRENSAAQIRYQKREVVLSLVGKYFVSFGPPSVMIYILSAFCMLWTHPRSTMTPPEVPNLKVLYQKEYNSTIKRETINFTYAVD